MSKLLVDSQESKEVAVQTVIKMAEIIKQTLGPCGNPIILQQMGQNPDGTPKGPLITKDGVTVAEYISFNDSLQETIARAVLQVAKSTVNDAGDGTTTAMVLAEAILKEGLKYVKQGNDGIQLYEELKKVKDIIIDLLEEDKIDVDLDKVHDVALISSNGDLEIANIVVDALEAVGEDGYIGLENGTSRNSELKIIEGAFYKQGWRKFSPLGVNMITDKARNVAEYSNPAVLLFAGKLESSQDLLGFIQRTMKADERGDLRESFPLMIVAHDFSDEVKNSILQAKVQGNMQIAAIKSPFDGSPNARTEMLEDLAVMLGGKVGAKGILELSDMSDEHLGCCDRVEVGEDETVFFGGEGAENEIIQRIEDLKVRLDNAMYDYDKDNIRLRIAKMTGGVALVYVGGDSELEILEKKDRMEDALCAGRVSIKHGILPGGGITLFNMSKELKGKSDIVSKIFEQALQAPIKQIIKNAGENPEVVLSHMPEEMGYDALNKKYVDMMKEGIIDPFKVTSSALDNAVSIAGLLLTTGGAVVLDSVQSQPANPFAAMMQGMTQ